MIARRQVDPSAFHAQISARTSVQRASLVFKRLRIVAHGGRPRNTLRGLTHSDKLIDGSSRKTASPPLPVDVPPSLFPVKTLGRPRAGAGEGVAADKLSAFALAGRRPCPLPGPHSGLCPLGSAAAPRGAWRWRWALPHRAAVVSLGVTRFPIWPAAAFHARLTWAGAIRWPELMNTASAAGLPAWAHWARLTGYAAAGARGRCCCRFAAWASLCAGGRWAADRPQRRLLCSARWRACFGVPGFFPTGGLLAARLELRAGPATAA